MLIQAELHILIIPRQHVLTAMQMGVVGTQYWPRYRRLIHAHKDSTSSQYPDIELYIDLLYDQ